MNRRLVVLGLALAAAAAVATASKIEDRFRDHIERAVDGGLEPLDFHHLELAFSWPSTLPDLRMADAALDRLAGVRPADPLMIDEVRLVRSRLAVDRGRPEAARELLRVMGGLTRWWVHGPSTIEELEDVRQLAAPAEDTDWRAAPGTDPLGWVRVDGVAWPARRQVAFLATTVTSDRDQPVALRLGTAQVARVWLNGVEILTTPQPLQRAEDQHAAGAWLGEGDNLVVAAVASESDEWWLRVRLTAPDGGPLTGVREEDVPPAPRPAVDREPPTIRTIESDLRRAMARGDDRAAIALAAYLVARRPQPDGAGDSRSVCRAARASSPGEARLLEWRLASDPRLAGELLREAVDGDGGLTWARIELARWYHDRGLLVQAEQVLTPVADEAAVRAASLDLGATLWGETLLPEIAEVARSAPRCVDANLVLARQAIEFQRWALAREAVDRLESEVGHSPPVREVVVRMATQCNDAERLRSVLTAELADDPNQPLVRVRLARLEAADDDRSAAREILRQGLDRCPDHLELLMELAGLEHAGGDEKEAERLARRVLELRPQDRRAQRLLGLLGEQGEDLGWLRTDDELRRMAAEAPKAKPAVVVLDHVEVAFLPSQLTEKRAQQVFLITDAVRSDEYLTHTLPYVSERQRLRVLAARVLRRDGSEIGARQSDTPRLTEPEFNLYYDTRLRVLRFSDLEDGDLIEIAYVLSETVEANETGPYEGGIVSFGHRVPVALAEAELTGPAHLLPEWELIHLEGEPERLTAPDGNARIRWRWRNLPAIPAEVPPSPPSLTVPQLAYSNHPEWGDLASWYARHIAPRIRPSAQVESAARRLTEGVSGRRNKIEQIYRFVTMDIRYVGLEFGEHRFRPFSADWVLTHRIGDCKDKAALMVSLLEAADIPARMVMVRTADQGVAASRIAQLEIFNHAIAYLPDDDLWLDGTASGHALQPPPTMCQGAQVLVVNGRQSAPQITPSPGGGLSSYRYLLRKADAGMVELEIQTEETGEAADLRRVQLAGSHDPRRVARWLQGQFPGADLAEEPKLQLIPARDPAVVELKGRVGRSALLGGGGIRTFPGELDWAMVLTPSGPRSSPLLIPVRPDLEWTVEVELGRAPERLPDPVDLDTAFGELKVDYRELAAGYRVTGRFNLRPGLVAAKDAEALREFLVTTERRLSRTLEVP